MCSISRLQFLGSWLLKPWPTGWYRLVKRLVQKLAFVSRIFAYGWLWSDAELRLLESLYAGIHVFSSREEGIREHVHSWAIFVCNIAFPLENVLFRCTTHNWFHLRNSWLQFPLGHWVLHTSLGSAQLAQMDGKIMSNQTKRWIHISERWQKQMKIKCM